MEDEGLSKLEKLYASYLAKRLMCSVDDLSRNTSEHHITKGWAQKFSDGSTLPVSFLKAVLALRDMNKERLQTHG